MAFIDTTSTDDFVDLWPYPFQEIKSGDDLYSLLTAFANEYVYYDDDINSLYDERFLDSATGRELEKLAAESGITRLEGESDTDLRFRARVGRAVAASNGTAEDIENIISVAFEDKNLGAIDVSHSTGNPVTRFEIPDTYLDDIPLSRADFEAELERAFPCGHAVEVLEGSTFRLGSSGSQGLSQGELI